VPLHLLETRVDVLTSGTGAQALAGAVTTAWDRCLAESDEPPADRRFAVLLDDDPAAVRRAVDGGVIAATTPAPILHRLAGALTVAAIEANLGRVWMLHACAVAHPQTGATVVLVGPSGAGKTTAAAVLGRHFAYLSDETAAIRPDGAVMPYPKPLSVLLEPGSPKQQRSPTALGLLAPAARPRLAAIALLERSGEAAPVVELIRTVAALPALAEQTSALQRFERPLHLMAGHLHATGGLRRIRYREAQDLVLVVAELMGRAP
jgi:hypothetical protein